MICQPTTSPRLKDQNKHIPPSNIVYLIKLLKFNLWVACQPTINCHQTKILAQKGRNGTAENLMLMLNNLLEIHFDHVDGLFQNMKFLRHENFANLPFRPFLANYYSPSTLTTNGKLLHSIYSDHSEILL